MVGTFFLRHSVDTPYIRWHFREKGLVKLGEKMKTLGDSSSGDALIKYCMMTYYHCEHFSQLITKNHCQNHDSYHNVRKEQRYNCHITDIALNAVKEIRTVSGHHVLTTSRTLYLFAT